MNYWIKHNFLPENNLSQITSIFSFTNEGKSNAVVSVTVRAKIVGSKQLSPHLRRKGLPGFIPSSSLNLCESLWY
jgi:hypothetical protein